MRTMCVCPSDSPGLRNNRYLLFHSHLMSRMYSHLTLVLLALLAAVAFSRKTPQTPFVDYDYCIIGAGPSGLQMGYHMERANRNYIILEREASPGKLSISEAL